MALGDGIRRDIAQVSQLERDRFRDAIVALNTAKFFPPPPPGFPAGSVSYWFKQDEVHQATHVHGVPAFLPWHRELCNRFEAMLREVDPDLSLHYWDWNTDPAPLFTNSFMGNANGDAGDPWLKNGFYNPNPVGDAFRDDTIHALNQPTPNPSTWSYDLHANPADPPQHLTRNKAAGPPPVGQPGWPADSALIAANTFSDFNNLTPGSGLGSHGSAHVYIGGTLANPHLSFRDPFVFLLHSNLDRLWAMWQTQPGHPERLDPNQVYGGLGADPSITAPLQPWAGTSDWPVRPWFTPENEQVVKTCKHPSVVTPPCYDTLPNFPATVTLQTPAQATFYSNLYAGKYQLAYNAEAGGPTPFYEMRQWLFSKNSAAIGTAAASNWERYSNPATDALLAQYGATTSVTMQKSIIAKLESVMVNQAPVIPVLEEVDWFQYNPTTINNFPTAANPYAQPGLYNQPDWGYVLDKLAPKA